MNRFSPVVVALCFSLSACSGQHNGDNTGGAPEPTSGSPGIGNVAGDAPAMGGSTDVGGAAASGGTGGEPVAGSGQGGEPALGGRAGSAGSAGSGGANAGMAGAGAGGKPPIDFSIWQLQLPTGPTNSPDTVAPKDLPTYTSPYFKPANDGGYVFMDPAQGTTTSGSMHCRSELRETNPNGGEAAWSSAGTNVMSVSGQVLMLSGGSKGSTTVGQVFVSGSNTLCELQYNGSQFKVFYEESKGNGQGPYTLAGAVPIKTKYTFALSLSKGVLEVSINGKVLWTKTPSSAVLSKKFYFKVGNYDQTSSAGTATTTPYTEVEAYTIDVVHN